MKKAAADTYIESISDSPVEYLCCVYKIHKCDMKMFRFLLSFSLFFYICRRCTSTNTQTDAQTDNFLQSSVCVSSIALKTRFFLKIFDRALSAFSFGLLPPHYLSVYLFAPAISLGWAELCNETVLLLWQHVDSLKTTLNKCLLSHGR